MARGALWARQIRGARDLGEAAYFRAMARLYLRYWAGQEAPIDQEYFLKRCREDAARGDVEAVGILQALSDSRPAGSINENQGDS